MSEFDGRAAPPPQGSRETRPADFVAVAEIVRAHGVRGEVAARLLCSDAGDLERCVETGRLLLVGRGVEGEEAVKPPGVAVKIVRVRGEFAVLRIEGIESRDAAQALRGSRLGLREGDLPALGKGDFYLFQLEAMEVVDAGGKRIGRVERILEMPAHDEILVAPEDPALRPFLIPMVEAIVREVDLEAKRIRVDLPQGLIESQQ